MSKKRPENLSEAAVTGDLPAFREFLREGCNVNKCDGYGRTALYYAAAHNRLFMVPETGVRSSWVQPPII